MSAHSPHPDSHEFGLADDCERCAEHAEHPERGLDIKNARRIWQGECYTTCDRIARARMQDIYDKGRWLERVVE